MIHMVVEVKALQIIMEKDGPDTATSIIEIDAATRIASSYMKLPLYVRISSMEDAQDGFACFATESISTMAGKLSLAPSQCTPDGKK